MFEVADVTSPWHSFTFAENGEYDVRGRITDTAGDFSEYQTTVIVQNDSPRWIDDNKSLVTLP